MALGNQQSINLHRETPYFEFLFKSLLWNNEIFKPFQYFCFIISNAQCLAITIHITFNCIVTTNHDDFSYVVKEVFRLLALEGIISFNIEDYGPPLIIFSVTLCYFAALFGLFARDAWKREHKLLTRLDSIMAYFTQFHLFIGFWLICTLLLKYVTLTVSSLIEPGLTAFQIFILIFSLIFLVLNYLFGFVFAHFSYDPFISSNILSSHSSNFHMFTWIFQAVIAPMLTSSDPSASLQWAMIVMPLILLAVRCGYLVYSFPYYNYWAMKTSLVFSVLAFAVSIVNLIAMIVSKSNSITPTALIYVVVPGGPLLIKATTILLDGIAMSYLTLPTRSLKRKEDVFKQIFSVRHLMSKAVLTVSKDMNRRPHEVRYLGGISHFYKLKTLQLENEDNKGITMNEICERSAEYSDKLTMDILQDAIKRFRNTDHFKVLLGHFSLTTNLSFLKTSLLVSNLENFNGRIKIVAAKVNKMLQEKIDNFFEAKKNEVLNLKGFLECQTLSADMNEGLRSITLKYIQFWTHYLKPQIIIKDLYKISHDIELEAANITDQWNAYKVKNKMLAHSFCNVYSTYLSLIRGSPQQAIKVMNKNFLNNLEEVIKSADEHSLSNEILISSNVMTLYGSMNSETPGKIIYSSSNINEILGWNEIDLSNQYVERIMPLFMREEHQKIVTNHVNLAIKGETKAGKLYTAHESFVLHKLGYTIPCEAYLSIHPFVQKDPMYMVLLRKRTVIQDDFLLVNQAGVIDGYSRELGDFLGLNLERRTSLRSICQEFTELSKALCDAGFQGKPHESFHKSWTKRTEDNLNKTEGNGIERTAKKDEANNKILTHTYSMMGGMHQQKIEVNFCVAGEKRDRSTQKYTVRITPKAFGSVTYFLLDLERELEKHNNANDINNFQSFAHQPVKNESSSEDDDLNENVAPLEEFYSVNPHAASKFWESHKCTTHTHHTHENVEKNLFSHHGTEASLNPILPNLKKHWYNPLTINTRMNSGTELSGKMKLNQKVRRASEVMTPKAKLLDQTLEKHKVLLSPVNSDKPLMIASPKTNADKIQAAKLNKERMKMQLSSSMGSSTKNYMNKLEQVVKTVPVNPQVKPLYFAFLLLITISVVPLIVFHFQNASVLNHVEGSIENISSTIFRIVRITDLAQTVRLIWNAKNGLFSSDRYYSLGFYGNITEELMSTLGPIISDVNQRNNEIRQSVYELDPSLQNNLYANRVPIFEMDNNGSIVSTRSGILLDVVTELVSEATNFLYSGLPFTKFNPYMLFIFNNTINYVLQAGQQTIPIIMGDSELKLSNQSTYIEAMIICLGVLGVAILVFLGYIQRQLVRDRSHFLNIFLMLKDHDITNQLNQAQEFLNIIEEQSTNLNKNEKQLQKFEGYTVAAKAKTRQLKRNTNTKGINYTLIILFIKGIALFILLLTGYIIMLESVKSKSSMIMSKINLMVTSNMDLFHINLLLSSIYEYIQNNGTTGLEGEPFSPQWEEIYAEMISSQDFLLLELLAPGNGLSSNAQLNQIITGDLCDAIPQDYLQLAAICKTIGGGAALRGMIGLNSYYLATARAVKDYYDNTAMSRQDKIMALANQGLVDFEAFYPFTLEAFTWVDTLIRSELVKDIYRVGNVVLGMVIGFTMVYIIVGGWLCHKVKYGLDREPAKWRRLLIQIPYTVIMESKLINSYLVKTSNGALMGGP